MNDLRLLDPDDFDQRDLAMRHQARLEAKRQRREHLIANALLWSGIVMFVGATVYWAISYMEGRGL